MLCIDCNGKMIQSGVFGQPLYSIGTKIYLDDGIVNGIFIFDSDAKQNFMKN